MARHKRILQDGQTSRGPARWARAAHNALLKPNSHGGRLYLHRTSLAYQVAEEARNSALFRSDTGFQHNKLWREDGRWTKRRDMVSCSVFCAVMTAQLVDNAENMAAIKLAFSTNLRTYNEREWEDSYIPRIEPLDRSTLVRKVRCFYCSATVPSTR